MVTAHLIELGDPATQRLVEEAIDGLADVGTSAELVLEDRAGPPFDAIEECARLEGVRVLRTRISRPESTGRLREELELSSEREVVFAFLACAEGSAVRLVVAGPGLPAMGRVPRCGLAQLRASFRYALGDLEADSESLFTEPSSLPDGDASLLDRLRQLYGE